MVRINLLPPEISEKRKFEQRLKWVIVGGVAAFVLIAVVWLFLQWQVSQRNDDLQVSLETSEQLLSQAEAFKVFELKETELAAMRVTAAKALESRIDWARIANELSLVMPAEAWLDNMEGTEEDGFTFNGFIIDVPDDVPDAGHKVVAKLLFRLADLELIDNVWLGSSMKTVDQQTDTPLLQFEVFTQIVKPAAPAPQTSSVPAPPAQSAE